MVEEAMAEDESERAAERVSGEASVSVKKREDEEWQRKVFNRADDEVK